MGLDRWAEGTGGCLICAALYAWNYWLRDRISYWLIPYVGLARRMPLRSAQLVVRIPFYGLPGIVVYVIFRLVRPGLVFALRPSLIAVLTGVVLGCGLMMASSALANGAFVAAYATAPRRRMAETRAEMRVAKDSGWIRGYTIAYRALPFWVFLALTVVSVSGEELAFRGVILPLTVHGFGVLAGYLVTLAGFIGIQQMFMPSWRGALVPMCGALVIGAVHGYFALRGSGVLLLIASHVGFFLVTTVTLLAEPRSTARPSGAGRHAVADGGPRAPAVSPTAVAGSPGAGESPASTSRGRRQETPRR
jgi:hypothetical protein